MVIIIIRTPHTLAPTKMLLSAINDIYLLGSHILVVWGKPSCRKRPMLDEIQAACTRSVPKFKIMQRSYIDVIMGRLLTTPYPSLSRKMAHVAADSSCSSVAEQLSVRLGQEYRVKLGRSFTFPEQNSFHTIKCEDSICS